jgi:hypothetical protein
MDNATRKFRRSLVETIGRCEVCGHDPTRAKTGFLAWRLDLHEIARGVNRQKALDKRYALLVLCYRCHLERIHGEGDWSEARQLAALKRSRPEDYDLVAYNLLIGRGPRRITEDEVDAWQ